ARHRASQGVRFLDHAAYHLRQYQCADHRYRREGRRPHQGKPLMAKIVSAAEAAKLVRDNAAVTVSSSSGLCCPDSVLKAIGERFDQERRPRNLTMIHPIAAGDIYGVPGIDHLAKTGLIARTIAGSYPSGPSSAEPPLIWQMIGRNEVAAYNIPSGILF